MMRNDLIRFGIRPLDFGGFALASAAALQIVLTARSEKLSYEQRLPVLQRLPSAVFLAGILSIELIAGFVAFHICLYLFGFYGLFLSVFAEMEPHSLFGRNGFINSDFFTPVAYLLQLFWPMALGTLVANGKELFGRQPWKPDGTGAAQPGGERPGCHCGQWKHHHYHRPYHS